MPRMTGKIALISGGARGIGAAAARLIVAEGGRVVIGDILDEEGEAFAGTLGDAARYVHLDVTETGDWDRAVALAVSAFGGLNVLVNNAGISASGALEEFDRERWQRVIDVNLTGPYLGIRAARDALVASAPSSIVNVSSTAGMQGQAKFHGYCAAKFGLRGLTKSVAMELAPLGVRSNSVHPGVVRTPLTEKMDVTRATGPIGRPGEADELGQLILFLASDESSYSTGAEFVADGGLIAGRGAPTSH